MLQFGQTVDQGAYVFGGKLVAQTEGFTVFESASGRILKLTGISREICERSVGTRITLDEILEEAGLETQLMEQLKGHLVRMRLFHEGGFHGFRKKYFRFRLDLPIIPSKAVTWLCMAIENSWNVGLAVFFLLLLASSTFLLAQGGMPFSFPPGASYKICMTSILVNTFIHEMGHAYALYYSGQKPGAIGLRIMGPFLAAYTDVNAAWALKPQQRALVSISGIAVQMVSTVIITALLAMNVDKASSLVFFWATVIAMIYMALPIRENDGDWFLKDMIEHSESTTRKRNLYIIRKTFAILGLAFCLYLLFHGWRISIVKVLDPTIGLNVWSYVLRFGFLTLGTWSMSRLALKEYRELSKKIKDGKS